MIGCIGKFKFSLAENGFAAWFQEECRPVQSGSLWLAPEVGPVKIKDASGISELIAFDVKSGSD